MIVIVFISCFVDQNCIRKFFITDFLNCSHMVISCWWQLWQRWFESDLAINNINQWILEISRILKYWTGFGACVGWLEESKMDFEEVEGKNDGIVQSFSQFFRRTIMIVMISDLIETWFQIRTENVWKNHSTRMDIMTSTRSAMRITHLTFCHFLSYNNIKGGVITPW